MRLRLTLIAIVLVLFSGSYWAKTRLGGPARVARNKPIDTERIVSLAPSLTEVLYALGLGDRVVGVSRYCHFPPEARTKPNVGGMADLNVEQLVALRPSLVAILAASRPWQPTFDALGIDTLTVEHRTIDGLLESIDTLGRRLGAEERAARLLADIHARLERVERRIAGRPRPRVLMCVFRTPGSGRLRDVYAAGGNAALHLNAILELAGGRNALEGTTIDFPVVSTEGILRANPEVILDLLPSNLDADVAMYLKDWRQLDGVSAVRTGRVHALAEDRVTVPGPRFVLVVEQIARLLHPEVDWDAPAADAGD